MSKTGVATTIADNVDVVRSAGMVPRGFRDFVTEATDTSANGATNLNLYTGVETMLGIPGGMSHVMGGAADYQEQSRRFIAKGRRFLIATRADSNAAAVDIFGFVNGRHTMSINTGHRQLGIATASNATSRIDTLAELLPDDGPHTIELVTCGMAATPTSNKGLFYAIYVEDSMGYRQPLRIPSAVDAAVMPTSQTTIPRGSLSKFTGIKYINPNSASRIVTIQENAHPWDEVLVPANQSVYVPFADGLSIALDSTWTHAVETSSGSSILFSVVGES